MRWPWIACAWAACSGNNGAGSPGASGPDYLAGVESICFAETRSGAIERFPFMDKAQTLNSWLEQRLDNDAARALYFERVLQASVLEQGELLRKEAARAGIESCPLAGYLDFTGRLSSQAGSLQECTAACVERNRVAADDASLERSCERGCGGALASESP